MKQNKLSVYGHFTINPFHLNKVLTLNEYHLFDTIRYILESTDLEKRISNSLIKLESHFTNGEQISIAKNNLLKLKFIKLVDVNKKLGTIYSIDYDSILLIIEKINSERNSINRLIIADEYRKSVGLNEINKSKIKEYRNSEFDNKSIIDDRYIFLNQHNTLNTNMDNNLDFQVMLNNLEYKLKNLAISKIEYEKSIIKIKDEALRNNIILNNENGQWITK
ncbi:hypothetical protein POZ24_00800 [Bacteroides uniformis]|uniref:Uncharacterized protein n=1 Tax=Bacteroides uniformis TaxID=820 RepID=A0AAW6GKL4_BACUN|nr:hypothetical protein [Bacteroides uniformis]MDC1878556.1 hypothetical protein [Bacteroides uniformis]MDC1882592.1 hypothetical protein [Bacteroides uniformis]